MKRFLIGCHTVTILALVTKAANNWISELYHKADTHSRCQAWEDVWPKIRGWLLPLIMCEWDAVSLNSLLRVRGYRSTKQPRNYSGRNQWKLALVSCSVLRLPLLSSLYNSPREKIFPAQSSQSRLRWVQMAVFSERQAKHEWQTHLDESRSLTRLRLTTLIPWRFESRFHEGWNCEGHWVPAKKFQFQTIKAL